MGAADLVTFSPPSDQIGISSVGSWGRPRKLKRAFNVEEKDMNSGVPEISSLLWPTTRWSFSLEESTAKRRTTRIHRYSFGTWPQRSKNLITTSFELVPGTVIIGSWPESGGYMLIMLVIHLQRIYAN